MASGSPMRTSIGFYSVARWPVRRTESITRLQTSAPDLWEVQGWRLRFGQPRRVPQTLGDRARPSRPPHSWCRHPSWLIWRRLTPGTMEYVRTLTPDALDAAIDGERTCGAILRHLVHPQETNHHGPGRTTCAASRIRVGTSPLGPAWSSVKPYTRGRPSSARIVLMISRTVSGYGLYSSSNSDSSRLLSMR